METEGNGKWETWLRVEKLWRQGLKSQYVREYVSFHLCLK